MFTKYCGSHALEKLSSLCAKLILNRDQLVKYLGFPLPELEIIYPICAKGCPKIRDTEEDIRYSCFISSLLTPSPPLTPHPSPTVTPHSSHCSSLTHHPHTAMVFLTDGQRVDEEEQRNTMGVVRTFKSNFPLVSLFILAAYTKDGWWCVCVCVCVCVFVCVCVWVGG